MLSNMKTLKGYSLNCNDDVIGKVKEFYFDDHYWTIRYLVADTGKWLVGRQVLLSPYALTGIDKYERNIDVNLTKKQIEDSPSLESDLPVSQQFEDDYYGYYQWPYYGIGAYRWGYEHDISHARRDLSYKNLPQDSWNPHLRSSLEVSHYGIEASDGPIGHVDDFILDDTNWAIRYLVVECGKWWSGKKVIISPDWIERVSWNDRKVFLNLSKESIRTSPSYQDDFIVNRDYEAGLYGHYNRSGYWLYQEAS